MSDVPQDGGERSMVSKILMAMGGIFVIVMVGFMGWSYSHMDDMERRQAANQAAAEKKMEGEITEANRQLRSSVDAVARQLGMNHKQLLARAAALQKEEQDTEARLSTQEEQTKQQFGAMSGEVNGVKGDVSKVRADVGGVRTDVDATKADLDATKAKLERAVGDLNKQSEAIATNRGELEVLKHRGDRNYFEFTLTKGKDPTRLATVGLQLKKADPKKSQFTIYVLADDKKIEKKDRTVNEPLQFYTGRDHSLFEVVVNTVDKNAVTGYLVTPKGVTNGGLQSQQAQAQQN